MRSFAKAIGIHSCHSTQIHSLPCISRRLASQSVRLAIIEDNWLVDHTNNVLHTTNELSHDYKAAAAAETQREVLVREVGRLKLSRPITCCQR